MALEPRKLFPTGQLSADGRQFMVKNGQFYQSVASLSGSTWSLTSFGVSLIPGTGTAAGSGVSVQETTGDEADLHRTVLTLSVLPQTITNGASEYTGTLVYTFPEGRILLLGALASLAFTTTSVIANSIASGATGAWSLGTTAASNASLTGTMVNAIPSTSYTSSTTINVPSAVVKAALAASAQFDGTTTPAPLYLNSSIATGTIDGTQTISGTITLTWIHLGDY